jgi:hypothetical protein
MPPECRITPCSVLVFSRPPVIGNVNVLPVGWEHDGFAEVREQRRMPATATTRKMGSASGRARQARAAHSGNAPARPDGSLDSRASGRKGCTESPTFARLRLPQVVDLEPPSAARTDTHQLTADARPLARAAARRPPRLRLLGRRRGRSAPSDARRPHLPATDLAAHRHAPAKAGPCLPRQDALIVSVAGSAISRGVPKLILISAPPSGALLASTKPPWASAACRTMANPRPDPGLARAVLAR